MSGDGCSRACELEEGFNCVGEFRNTCLGLCPIFGGVSVSHFCELLLIITITFDVSIVCLALIVSHIFSHLIPTINMGRLNGDTESLNNLLSLNTARSDDVRI